MPDGTAHIESVNLYGTDSGTTESVNYTWSSMYREAIVSVLGQEMQGFFDGVLANNGAQDWLIQKAVIGEISLYEAGMIYDLWLVAEGLTAAIGDVENKMFVLSAHSGGDITVFFEFKQQTENGSVYNPDGTFQTDGQTFTSNPDGSFSLDTTSTGGGLPDGSTFVSENPDGTVTWQAPDGTFWTENADGTFTQNTELPPDDTTGGVDIPDGMEPIVNPDTLEVIGYSDPATGQEFNLDGTPLNPPGTVPPGDGPGEDTFLDNAQSTIDRQVALENQTRDPFRDAILQFFPDLNLPGQQTIEGTRPFFDAGFALQGGGDQQQVFETITEFLRQGGDPITAQEAMRRLGELHPEFQAFQTDPTAFLDQFSPENQAAKLQTFGDLFISEGTEGLLGARDARFDAVFDPLQAQTSKFVSPALTSAIDFWRDLFNSQRGDPNDDFFIDFLAKSGVGSEFLSGFQQPSGVDFFGTGGL